MSKIHKKYQKSSFVWNTIGSILNAASSFFLLLCVTRTVGAEDSGIFSFAFANAQLLLTIGKFGVRSYQATDVSHSIATSTYLVSRVLSCIAMLSVCLLWIIVSNYNSYDAGIIIAVCLMKASDAVEDIFHGWMQLNGKLDLAGKLLSIRNIFTMVLFFFLIYKTGNLYFTCWFTGVVSFALSIVINLYYLNKAQKTFAFFRKNELYKLFKDCFPLFIGSFLSLYIYNVPKYAIERYSTPDLQTYYSIIFMPAFVINLFSEFAFKPLLTSLATYWENKNIIKLKKMISKLMLIIILLTIVSLIIAKLFGVTILSVIYKVDVLKYELELVILMLGGGFGAVVYFLYNFLTVMRKQIDILKNYFFAALFSTLLAFGGVKCFSILGASISYFISEIILCIFMMISVYKFFIKKEVKNADRNNYISRNK